MSITIDKKKLMTGIMHIAHEAGQAILEIYRTSFTVSFKEDASPLTKADTTAQYLIFLALKELTSHIPIVCEEIENPKVNADMFWLVDPLDGTKEFINRNDEFTVNIALIKNNLPLLGVIYAPALNLFYGGIVGDEAFKITSKGQRVSLHTQSNISSKTIVVCSRSHGDRKQITEFLTRYPKSSICAVGSSLKFCKIAEGSAHLYPRFGRTMEWDTAAGQAILMAAGGSIVSLDGGILTYGKKDFENPHFIASSSINLLREQAH
eukprot:TRINITY_DN3343_c0_g1_i1.p1 TRINITY_DN3343_c0_g1~~TRINITY_DN3343_c0_g1_i1.p1  ORF type:complete len:264 (+),score=23.19 TRINITY_DN3343_c0_g1_i1:55-846(+)